AGSPRRLQPDVEILPGPARGPVGGDRPADFLPQRVRRQRQRQIERAGRALQALPVLGPGEEDPVVGAPDLIDGVAVEKAAVERRERRLGGGVQPAVGVGLNMHAAGRVILDAPPPPSATKAPAYLRALTRPSAFLMFCTLGSEIPTSLAICAPVLPDSESFFTWARVASVITERLRRLAAPA